MQCSSYGESISTLGFGSRVSEITLGQAKKNSESAQIFEAKDQVVRWALGVLVLLPCKHLPAATCQCCAPPAQTCVFVPCTDTLVIAVCAT